MLLFGLFCVVATVLSDPTKTIVENAIATPSLSTLVAVLTTKGYEPVLKALSDPKGHFTVFAPNNDAFAEAKLNVSEVEAITATLLYHTLGAEVKSTDLKALQFVHTLSTDPKYVFLNGSGQSLGVSKEGSVVRVNGIRVVLADVICSNGIVHVIDHVIRLPQKTSTTATEAKLNTLVSAVVKAALVDAVDTTPGITIFAPTDDAFRRAGIDPAKVDKATLTKVLTYHVVPAVAFSTDIKDGEKVPTLEGDTLTLRISGGRVYVNKARVEYANVIVADGVVHVIDAVLLPKGFVVKGQTIVADPTKTIVENAIATPSLSTLVAVLTTKGYEPVLKALSDPKGHFTVFAPNNDAFAEAKLNVSEVEAITATLLYHTLGAEVKSTDLKALQFVHTLSTDPKYVYLNGSGQSLGVSKEGSVVRVNGIRVVLADVICSNGIVHVIDRVIRLPEKTSTTATKAKLNTLVSAVVKAALVDAVDTTPGITIFAPTDDAFRRAGIDPAKVDKATLTKVLTYHVVPAVAFSTDIKDGEKVPTLEGDTLTLRIKEGRVYVNKARVEAANIIVADGVVHVIDAVLLPKGF